MTEADGVVPGPCHPDCGCPPPTEIDCIEVTKVYDFCFQTDTETQPFSIPASCGTIPVGSTAAATVTSVACTAQTIAPISGSGGFANVTMLIAVTESITITSPSGTAVCTFTGEFWYMKTITLCAPAGTAVTCSAPNTSVTAIVVASAGEVVTTTMICLLTEATALVKLLVPTYGFCVPAPCVVLPTPPLSCPPSPLFPPQCPVPTPTLGPAPCGCDP